MTINIHNQVLNFPNEFPFWCVASPWDNTTMYLLLYIYYQNCYQLIKQINGKNQRILPFGTYLPLGIT